MKIKKIAILGFLSLLLFAGCGEKKEIKEDVLAQEKQVQNPVFQLTSVQGKKITIEIKKEGWVFKGLENKVVLLNFFGTWCPPCKAEIPHLEHIRDGLKKDFEILAIDVGPRGGGYNSQEHLEAFIKEFGINYPIVSGEKATQLFGAVSQLNPSGAIPFMVLLNKKGQSVQYYIGMTPEEMLTNDIKTAIKMK